MLLVIFIYLRENLWLRGSSFTEARRESFTKSFRSESISGGHLVQLPAQGWAN